MRTIHIATGPSRFSKNWRNQQITWDALAKQLEDTKRTRETMAEYKAMKKKERGEIKDVGGFVGGKLKGPRRKAQNLELRSIITLDADNLKNPDELATLWDTVTLIYGFEAVMYTTHSHTPEVPRVRLIILMNRDTDPDEYVAISRYVAEMLNIEIFDTTTHDPVRLMYWPSTSQDGEYRCEVNKGVPVDVDAILADHPEWTNMASLPKAKREEELQQKAKEAEDPRDKRGPVGDFCRAYGIHEAIAEFLPEVYTPSDVDDERYTYASGSSALGMQVMDSGLKAHSYHGTDPAAGQHNAFDLVRIHKFGDLDDDAKPETPINRLPSYLAMAELVEKDEKVKQMKQEELTAIFNEYNEAVASGGEYALDPREVFFEGQRFVHARLKQWFTGIKKCLIIGDEDAPREKRKLYVFDGKRYVAGRPVFDVMASDILGEYMHTKHTSETYKQLLSDGDLPTITYEDATDVGVKLVVENGILNLKTGELEPHTPEMKTVIKLPVVYDPDASCPNIERFLEMVAPGLQDLIYEIVGYCLSPDMHLEKSIMLYGQSGANGKGTLLEIIETLIGVENIAGVSPQELSDDRFAGSNLFGKMVNINSDIPNSAIKDSSLFKRMVSGDRVRVQRKGEDSFMMKPRAKFLFSANELPNSFDNSGGFHRRWIIIPLEKKFDGTGFRHKLFTQSEMSGFLNKAVEGYQRMKEQQGLSYNEIADRMTEEYRKKSDSAYAFLTETCGQGDTGDRVPKQQLYNNYQTWCRDHGNRPVSAAVFNEKVLSLFNVTEYKKGRRQWDKLVHDNEYFIPLSE